MWEEMWENKSENPLFIYKIQYLMRWFGTSPATTFWFRLGASALLAAIAVNRFVFEDWLFGTIAMATALVLASQLRRATVVK